jgi:hypothetical protein
MSNQDPNSGGGSSSTGGQPTGGNPNPPPRAPPQPPYSEGIKPMALPYQMIVGIDQRSDDLNPPVVPPGGVQPTRPGLYPPPTGLYPVYGPSAARVSGGRGAPGSSEGAPSNTSHGHGHAGQSEGSSKPNARWTAEEIQLLVELYRERVAWDEISRRTGRTESACRSKLHGLQLGPSG